MKAAHSSPEKVGLHPTLNTQTWMSHSSSNGSRVGWCDVCWGRRATWGQSCCREGQPHSHFLLKRVGWRWNLPLSLFSPECTSLRSTFMRRWGVGCGFLGEQGAESIHAYFNILDHTYVYIYPWLASVVETEGGWASPTHSSHQYQCTSYHLQMTQKVSIPRILWFLYQNIRSCICKFLEEINHHKSYTFSYKILMLLWNVIILHHHSSNHSEISLLIFLLLVL